MTAQEMEEARIPRNWRDACAHLLVPLNARRVEHFYLPFR